MNALGLGPLKTLLGTCLSPFDLPRILNFDSSIPLECDIRVFYTNNDIDPGGDSNIVWFFKESDYGCVLTHDKNQKFVLYEIRPP